MTQTKHTYHTCICVDRRGEKPTEFVPEWLAQIQRQATGQHRPLEMHTLLARKMQICRRETLPSKSNRGGQLPSPPKTLSRHFVSTPLCSIGTMYDVVYFLSYFAKIHDTL